MARCALGAQQRGDAPCGRAGAGGRRPRPGRGVALHGGPERLARPPRPGRAFHLPAPRPLRVQPRSAGPARPPAPLRRGPPAGPDLGGRLPEQLGGPAPLVLPAPHLPGGWPRGAPRGRPPRGSSRDRRLEHLHGRGGGPRVAAPGRPARGGAQEARGRPGQARGGARQAARALRAPARRRALPGPRGLPVRGDALELQRGALRVGAVGGGPLSGVEVRERRGPPRVARHDRGARGPRSGRGDPPRACPRVAGLGGGHPSGEPAAHVRVAGEQRLQRGVPRHGPGGPRGRAARRTPDLLLGRAHGGHLPAQPRAGGKHHGPAPEPLGVHQAGQRLPLRSDAPHPPRGGRGAGLRPVAAGVPPAHLPRAAQRAGGAGLRAGGHRALHGASVAQNADEARGLPQGQAVPRAPP